MDDNRTFISENRPQKCGAGTQLSYAPGHRCNWPAAIMSKMHFQPNTCIAPFAHCHTRIPTYPHFNKCRLKLISLAVALAHAGVTRPDYHRDQFTTSHYCARPWYTAKSANVGFRQVVQLFAPPTNPANVCTNIRVQQGQRHALVLVQFQGLGLRSADCGMRKVKCGKECGEN